MNFVSVPTVTELRYGARNLDIKSRMLYQNALLFCSDFFCSLITKRAKLLNADWSMNRVFFLNFA